MTNPSINDLISAAYHATTDAERIEKLQEALKALKSKETVATDVDPATAISLLEAALQEAIMGCGGKHGDTVSSLFGGPAGPKPDGWKTKRWAGETMPKSEMSAWCSQARQKMADAGVEVDKKSDGPTLILIIQEALASITQAPVEASGEEVASEAQEAAAA